MPLHDYECVECGIVEERLLPLGHGPQRHCGSIMERVLSAPNRYEGSAFYTEYGMRQALDNHKQVVSDQIRGKFTLPRNPYGSTINGIDH